MPLTFKQPADGTLVTTFSGKALTSTHREKKKQTTGLILLSIQGNPHCQGLHLQAIVEKAFCLHTEVTILVGDELQWHNLKTGSVDDQEMVLKQQAIAMGDAYLRNNLQYILNAIQTCFPDFDRYLFETVLQDLSCTDAISTLNEMVTNLGTPFKIVRWRDWVTNPSIDYNSKQSDILALFDIPDSELNKGLQESTNQYTRRKLKDKPEMTTDERNTLQEQSRGYLREECAAIICVGAALGINVMAYPGKLMKLFQITKNTFVLNADAQSSNPLAIMVENRDQLLSEVNIEFKTKKLPQEPACGTLKPSSSSKPETDACAPVSGSPVSVAGLIQQYELLAKRKEVGGTTTATRQSKHQAVLYKAPRSPARKPSSAVAPCRTRFFSDRSADREVSSRQNIDSFISGLTDQITTYAAGLPSEQSKLLARALLAQSCHLLDRSPTPVMNLTR